MAFTSDGIAPPGIPLLGCSPPTTMRYRTVFGRDTYMYGHTNTNALSRAHRRTYAYLHVHAHNACPHEDMQFAFRRQRGSRTTVSARRGKMFLPTDAHKDAHTHIYRSAASRRHRSEGGKRNSSGITH